MSENSENIEQQIREVLSDALPGVVFRRIKRIPLIENRQVDLILDVQFHALDFRLIIEVKNQPSFSSARIKDSAYQMMEYVSNVKGEAIPLIVAPYISSRHQDLLREMGVAYLDLSGNISLRFKSIHIDRRGFKNRFREDRIVKDPFSDKASLALRILLESDKSWGIRELAREAQLSPGYASKVVSRCEELGYVSRSHEGIKLRDARSILDDWVIDYSKKSKSRKKVRKFFCRANSPIEVMSRMASLDNPPSDAKYALSFHAGAHFVDPYASFEVVDVYIDDLKIQSYFAHELKMRSVEKGENVRFRSPFYKESAFFRSRRLDNLWVVSDLQLYLDLYHYPIRGREQAEHIYQRRLRRIIERQ